MKDATTLSMSIRIWGGALRPAEVTSFLGVPSTESQTKGERRNAPAGKVFVAPTGMWSRSYPDCKDADELLVQLRDVLQRFEPGKKVVDIRGAEEARIDIYVSRGSLDLPAVEIVLTSAEVHSLSRIGLGVAITVL